MNVLIIDDEPKARKLLQVLLEENCPKVVSVFVAEDLLQGIDVIKQEKPQVVFLDIEMPEYSGLEILDFIDKDQYNFEIIFTTAYSGYAIDAFELSAIDYLLKPLRVDKLKMAVDKALNSLENSQTNLKLEALRQSLKQSNFNKIALPVANGIKFVNFDDIFTLTASGMYTEISTRSEGDLLISKPLKYFVKILQKISTFYKPHRSHLINLKYIKAYSKRDGGYIVMDNNKTISISKDKKEEFLTIVQNKF